MSSLIIIIAMFALLWLLLIRPQRAKQQQQQRMLGAVEPGDEILTVGGLFGIVQEIDEDEDLVVEIADGIHVRVARRAVANVVKPDDDEDEALVEIDDELVDDELVDEEEPLDEASGLDDGERVETPGEEEVKDEVETVNSDQDTATKAEERS